MTKTKVLLSMGTPWQTPMGEILTEEGFEVVDAYTTSRSALVRMFDDTKADVLFIEPGSCTFEAPREFVELYTAMDGKPIVLCSASYYLWLDFCSRQDLTVIVTGNCVMPPKYSYKEEIERALALMA